MNPRSNPSCRVHWLGRVDYLAAWRLQERLARERSAGRIPDSLLLLEHPPTYTLGAAGEERHLLTSPRDLEKMGVHFYRVDRGGDITFHGPGQLVGYPVLRLETHGGKVGTYLRKLEAVIIRTLDGCSIHGTRVSGYTGVWVGGEKIAAVGVKVDARGITRHGFALNVTTDLAYFSAIIPCGIQDKGVTSMARVLGEPMTTLSVARRLSAAFEEIFEMRVIPMTTDREAVPGDLRREASGEAV